MSELDYLRYDVFTDTAFTGNPLAVVLDPPPMTAAQMQTVAGEFNLSETVFVTRRTATDADVRIFTPGAELPFAGHPTVGAAVALVDADAGPGAGPRPGSGTGPRPGPGTGPVELTFHEGVGAVPVRVEAGSATLTTPAPPHPVETVDPGDVARCLGLGLADLHRDAGVSAWSAGVAFTIVTVADLDVLARAAIDPATWSDELQFSLAPEVYVLCPLDGIDGHRWRARMFAPGLGVGEDPATGSAAAAAAGYLAGRVSAARAAAGWQIVQGVEMGRPSTIDIGLVRGTVGEVTGVTVGGRAVPVGSGRMAVPA